MSVQPGLVNSYPNQIYTAKQIVDFINASGSNAINYAVQRNPTTMLHFIRQNYPKMDFSNYGKGLEVTSPIMETMIGFLERSYDALPTKEAKDHFIFNVLHSLPRNAQTINWTTPTN